MSASGITESGILALLGGRANGRRDQGRENGAEIINRREGGRQSAIYMCLPRYTLSKSQKFNGGICRASLYMPKLTFVHLYNSAASVCNTALL